MVQTMSKELVFRTAAAEALGIDPRTMEKRGEVRPIGTIKIGNPPREFDVYDLEGIQALTGKELDQ
jgi:hypothetical protein